MQCVFSLKGCTEPRGESKAESRRRWRGAVAVGREMTNNGEMVDEAGR